MGLERGRIEFSARRLLQDRVEIEPAADTMYVGTKPAQKRRQVTATERVVETSDLFPHGLHQLRGGHRPKRVVVKTAKHACIPMEVLQTAQCVVRRRDAKQSVEPIVPGTGQVGKGQVPGCR
jgi:hypothetical protein